jgi:hypothetical protein
MTLTVRVTPKAVELRGGRTNGSVYSKRMALPDNGSVLIPVVEATAR